MNFEVGKYYIFTGNKVKWWAVETMIELTNHIPVKCTSFRKHSEENYELGFNNGLKLSWNIEDVILFKEYKQIKFEQPNMEV